MVSAPNHSRDLSDPDRLPVLSSACIQVRWFAVDDVAQEAWDSLRDTLDADEQARAVRFHFDIHRQAYIGAHALLRAMLSAHFARPPSSWKFGVNAFGKPYLAPEPGLPPVQFNLSHTRGLVAVALAVGHDVGIDVEAVDPKRLGRDLALRVFARDEIALLDRTPEAELSHTLFRLWTLKEACIKAIGKGLLVPLDQFTLGLDPPSVAFSADLGEDARDWTLWQMAPTPGFWLALAIKRQGPAEIAIEAAQIDAAGVLAMSRSARDDARLG